MQLGLLMDFVLILFELVGGLALFLYGMLLLSNGLQKAAGDRLRYWIEKLTNSKLKGVAVGAIFTGIIQSSSVTTVTLVGLINAGLISLEQSIPVIMGANIGTTVTAQLVAFKVGALALPTIALGFLLSILSKKQAYKYFGEAILGFGLLFLGMNTMSTAMSPLQSEPAIINQLAELGKTPIFGIAVGAIFTGIIQSSSATSGLVIAMASGKLLDLPAAIAIILGANIGTCVTALLAAIGTSLSGKRAALSHLLFNIFGVLVFFLVFSFFVSIVELSSSDLPRQIANAHLMFNVATTIMLLPFVGALVFTVKKILPGKEIRVDRGVRFMDKRTLGIPSIAIAQAEKEAERMGKIALSALEDSIAAFKKNNLQLVQVVKKKEDSVDELDDAIERFLIRITQGELNREQAKRVASLVHSISDIERVSDHANNIAELAEIKARKKLVFSKQAGKEMNELFEKSTDSYKKSIIVLVKKDKQTAEKVFALEREIDSLTKQLEQNHFERLKAGKCRADSGVVFAELLRNLERISDHAHNIAIATIHGF